MLDSWIGSSWIVFLDVLEQTRNSSKMTSSSSAYNAVWITVYVYQNDINLSKKDAPI